MAKKSYGSTWAVEQQNHCGVSNEINLLVPDGHVHSVLVIPFKHDAHSGRRLIAPDGFPNVIRHLSPPQFIELMKTIRKFYYHD